MLLIFCNPRNIFVVVIGSATEATTVLFGRIFFKKIFLQKMI